MKNLLTRMVERKRKASDGTYRGYIDGADIREIIGTIALKRRGEYNCLLAACL